jgi:tRNA dimethylallyltransferase
VKGKKILVIAGPTASGKSSLALGVARKCAGVVINADSVQLYSGLPILSAQPSPEEQKIVEHKLYSVLSPRERNTLFDWLDRAGGEIEEAMARGKLAIVVGGTGLYISRLMGGVRTGIPGANSIIREELSTLYEELGQDKFFEIVQKIDPEAVLGVDSGNRQRLLRIYEVYRLSGEKLSELRKLPNERTIDRGRMFLLSIMPEREILYARCNLRFRNMLNNGAPEEVRLFMKNYPEVFNSSLPVGHTIGFREIGSYLRGDLGYEDMIELVSRNTRRYAKRQYTWFRNQFMDIDYRIDYIPSEEEIDKIVEKITDRL